LAEKNARQWQFEHRGLSAAVTPQYGKISTCRRRIFFAALSIAGSRKRR
jgi:hypothetical protein